jgi:hypothetical protein
MTAAAGQHRMVGAGGVQLGSGRQAPLGQVRLMPGDGGLHPLPLGGRLSRTTDRVGELGDAAGLPDRDQRGVLGRLQQVLVRVANAGSSVKSGPSSTLVASPTTPSRPWRSSETATISLPRTATAR